MFYHGAMNSACNRTTETEACMPTLITSSVIRRGVLPLPDFSNWEENLFRLERSTDPNKRHLPDCGRREGEKADNEAAIIQKRLPPCRP